MVTKLMSSYCDNPLIRKEKVFSGFTTSAVLALTHISHCDVSVDVQQLLSDLRPHAVWYVHPGAGRTLLTSVLERWADRPLHHALNIRWLVDKVEILPAALWKCEEPSTRYSNMQVNPDITSCVKGQRQVYHGMSWLEVELSSFCLSVQTISPCSVLTVTHWSSCFRGSAHLLPVEGRSCRCPGSGRPASKDAWTSCKKTDSKYPYGKFTNNTRWTRHIPGTVMCLHNYQKISEGRR